MGMLYTCSSFRTILPHMCCRRTNLHDWRLGSARNIPVPARLVPYLRYTGHWLSSFQLDCPTWGGIYECLPAIDIAKPRMEYFPALMRWSCHTPVCMHIFEKFNWVTRSPLFAQGRCSPELRNECAPVQKYCSKIWGDCNELFCCFHGPMYRGEYMLP